MKKSRTSILQATLLVSALFLILITLLALLPYDHWWIRVWDFPRFQILCLIALTSFLCSWLLRPWKRSSSLLLTALLACGAYQFLCIVPYTLLYPTQVESTTRLESLRNFKLLTANVLMENKEPEALVAMVEELQPDLLLVTETNGWWLEQLQGLHEQYPFRVSHPLENTYGIALYSKLELRSSEIKFLVENDIPSIHTHIVLRSGEQIKFYGIHPRPPAPQEAESTTFRDAELIVVAKEVAQSPGPAVVAGDLNDVAWSRTTRLFQKISQMLDPRIGRGFFNTFHADYPFLRYPLDHVFHSSEFRLAGIQKLGHIGSDHFPILLHLSLEESAEKTQEEPLAEPEEEEEAEEMIEEAEEKKEEED